ncbi:hypothetical protein [Candidatus Deianiraea vastatrix]|nr:hypothetical protein [Candidatus Deianiraea vastatrix]
MRKLLIISILLLYSNISNAVNNAAQNKQKDEILNNDKSLDEDIKDYFTDEDGNILEPAKIPLLKATMKNWKVLVGNVDGRKICYAFSKPFAKVGNHKDSRDAYLMVIYFNKKRQDVNISMGFSFKTGSIVQISVDGKQFSANTKESIAIPNHQGIDSEIVKSMIYAKRVLVKGDSRIGTYGVDAYSCDNFQDVYAKLIELCDFM